MMRSIADTRPSGTGSETTQSIADCVEFARTVHAVCPGQRRFAFLTPTDRDAIADEKNRSIATAA